MPDSYVKSYTFRAGGDETHAESLRRLCDEVGWTYDVDDATLSRLSGNRAPVKASRARMTRAEFISRLTQPD